MEQTENMLNSTRALADSLTHVQDSGLHSQRMQHVLQQQKYQLEYIQHFIQDYTYLFKTLYTEIAALKLEAKTLNAEFDAATAEKSELAVKCASLQESTARLAEEVGHAYIDLHLNDIYLYQQAALTAGRAEALYCSQAVLGSYLRAVTEDLEALQQQLIDLSNKIPRIDKSAYFSVLRTDRSMQMSALALSGQQSVLSAGTQRSMGSSLFRSAQSMVNSRRDRSVNYAVRQRIIEQELQYDLESDKKFAKTQEAKIGKLRTCAAVLLAVFAVCLAL